VTGDAAPTTEGVDTTSVMVGVGIARSVALVRVLLCVMSVTGGLEKLSDGFQQITDFFGAKLFVVPLHNGICLYLDK